MAAPYRIARPRDRAIAAPSRGSLPSARVVHNVRQHVNPLSARYQVPRAKALARPLRLDLAPLDVELGCADAKFSFELARAHRDRWIVGLEIREAWVEENRRRAHAEGLDNLDFAYCNVGVDLDRVFGPRCVDRFHVLFPDPWFKRRHHKRRVFDEGLADTLHSRLRAGGLIHIATDVFELALDAMDVFERHADRTGRLANVIAPWRFARDNPFEATSRREDTTHARRQRVWRLVYAARGAAQERSWAGASASSEGSDGAPSNAAQRS